MPIPHLHSFLDTTFPWPPSFDLSEFHLYSPSGFPFVQLSPKNVVFPFWGRIPYDENFVSKLA